MGGEMDEGGAGSFRPSTTAGISSSGFGLKDEIARDEESLERELEKNRRIDPLKADDHRLFNSGNSPVVGPNDYINYSPEKGQIGGGSTLTTQNVVSSSAGMSVSTKAGAMEGMRPSTTAGRGSVKRADFDLPGFKSSAPGVPNQGAQIGGATASSSSSSTKLPGVGAQRPATMQSSVRGS